MKYGMYGEEKKGEENWWISYQQKTEKKDIVLAIVSGILIVFIGFFILNIIARI